MASRPVISASPAAATVTAHVTPGARAAKKAHVMCPYSHSIGKTVKVVTKIV